MTARIYCPAQTVMQSGSARSNTWVLEYGPMSRQQLDPLMGWTSSSDTRAQIRINFATKEEAVKYAEANGLDYTVVNPKLRKQIVRARGYCENFLPDRKDSWTH